MDKATRFLAYVQLLDSALPIGSFSHSFGLETYVQEGHITDRKQLEMFIESQIHGGLVRFEGLTVKGCHLALGRDDLREFCAFDCILIAQRLSRESREGLQKMGKRLLKLAETLHPWMDIARLKDALQRFGGTGCLPSIHAYLNFHLGIDCDDTVRGYLYTGVNMMISSALRLMPIGQTDGQAILARMLPVIEREWQAVKDLPPERLHSFNISQEIAAMNHETLYSRLFMS